MSEIKVVSEIDDWGGRSCWLGGLRRVWGWGGRGWDGDWGVSWFGWWAGSVILGKILLLGRVEGVRGWDGMV